ncbi:uncharacterized protein [Ptychodera flava]|uniref:uncharacterized protein n=1 Tax=Ptychodera flava TaxID=63121 RepID=UPI00396AAE82
MFTGEKALNDTEEDAPAPDSPLLESGNKKCLNLTDVHGVKALTDTEIYAPPSDNLYIYLEEGSSLLLDSGRKFDKNNPICVNLTDGQGNTSTIVCTDGVPQIENSTGFELLISNNETSKLTLKILKVNASYHDESHFAWWLVNNDEEFGHTHVFVREKGSHQSRAIIMQHTNVSLVMYIADKDIPDVGIENEGGNHLFNLNITNGTLTDCNQHTDMTVSVFFKNKHLSLNFENVTKEMEGNYPVTLTFGLGYSSKMTFYLTVTEILPTCNCSLDNKELGTLMECNCKDETPSTIFRGSNVTIQTTTSKSIIVYHLGELKFKKRNCPKPKGPIQCFFLYNENNKECKKCCDERIYPNTTETEKNCTTLTTPVPKSDTNPNSCWSGTCFIAVVVLEGIIILVLAGVIAYMYFHRKKIPVVRQVQNQRDPEPDMPMDIINHQDNHRENSQGQSDSENASQSDQQDNNTTEPTQGPSDSENASEHDQQDNNEANNQDSKEASENDEDDNEIQDETTPFMGNTNSLEPQTQSRSQTVPKASLESLDEKTSEGNASDDDTTHCKNSGR